MLSRQKTIPGLYLWKESEKAKREEEKREEHQEVEMTLKEIVTIFSLVAPNSISQEVHIIQTLSPPGIQDQPLGLLFYSWQAATPAKVACLQPLENPHQPAGTI